MRSLVHIPRKGPLSNLDVKIDPLELQRSMKLEEHMSVYEDFLASGKAGDGTYGYQGELARGKDMLIPKAAMAGGISGMERAHRVRARMQSGQPPIMISYDTASDTPLFAEEDQEAFEAGFVCINCYQYQAVPSAPKCNWFSNSERGCGHTNY